MFEKKIVLFAAVLLLNLALVCSASASNTKREYDECLLASFQNMDHSTTLEEVLTLCSKEIKKQESTIPATPPNQRQRQRQNIVQERFEADESNILKPFTLMSHRQNYFLFAAHNFQGWSSKEIEDLTGHDEIDLDDTEAQFQISIKTPLATDLFDTPADIYAAYTMRSFWQVYNSDISSPFRETNHEPEIWIQVPNDSKLFGFTNSGNAIGIAHQSNGQAESYSRSWNRVYALLGFEKQNFAFAIKPWIRIPEDSEDDDNPDITDYMGHGELHMAYRYDDYVFSLMTRNNLESGFTRGAIELGFSFPLFKYQFLKGYVQYFSGYGESLIDYDNYVNRIGVGILLTDFL